VRTTEFFDITVFGDQAEHACQSLAKGDRVVLVGTGEIETWVDSEGKERTTKRILVNAIGPDLRWKTATVDRVARKAPAEDGGFDQMNEEPF
jgi:single-strand DNA-binding protein